MRVINKKDLLLMSFFRSNARENLTHISRETKIPVSTIFDKLKNYEETLIKKYTTLIDFKKIGYDIKVQLLLKVGKDAKEELKQFLVKHPSINSLYRTNNGFDYLIEGVFKDMNDMQIFMESIEGFNILEKQEMFILEELSRETFLAKP